MVACEVTEDDPHTFDKDERRRPYEGHCRDVESKNFALDLRYNQDYYFADCQTIGAVTIQIKDLQYISPYLFYGSSITSLTITKDVSPELIIKEGAFAFCNSLTSVTFPTFDPQPTIANGIRIDAGAFLKCVALSSVNIIEPITKIGPSSFEGCLALNPTFNTRSSVRLNIYSYAFYKCNQKESATLTLPAKNVISIGHHAFEDCKFSIKEVHATAIGDFAFSGCTFTNLKVDCGEIGNSAFKGTGSLSSIPKTVKIGSYAFSGLTINNPLEFLSGSQIGKYAFYNCKYLTASNLIKLTRTSVDSYAFSSSISDFKGEIKIESSTIGSHAFENFGKTFTLTFTDTLSGTSSISEYAFYSSGIQHSLLFNGSTINSIGTKAFAKCAGLDKDLTIIDDLTINSYAFEGCNFKNIKIVGKQDIGQSAFEGHGPITSLVIGEEETDYSNDNYPESSIGKRAFYGVQINSLEIHSSVFKIEEYAFAKLTLPKNYILNIYATTIDAFAFSQCTPIHQLNIYSKNVYFHAFDGTKIDELTIDYKDKNYDKDDPPSISIQAFYNLEIGSLTIGKEYVIEKSAFWNCKFGSKIDINDATIGPYAFADCQSDGCTLRIGNSDIGEYAFTNFKKINVLEFNGDSLAQNQKTIGTRAFYGASIINKEGLTIPAYISDVGDHAFASIDDLEPNSLILNCERLLTGSFYGCGKIKTFQLGNSLTDIQAFAFYGTNLVGELVIPKSVKNIGQSAFQGLTLGKITLFTDSELTTIGISAFQGSGISGELQIPPSVNEIGNYAFSQCRGLTSVSFYTMDSGVALSIGDFAFYDCGNLDCYLDIPVFVSNIGKYAFANCEKLKGHLSVGLGIEIGEGAFENSGSFDITAINVYSYDEEEHKVYDIKAETFKGLNVVGKLTIPAPVKNIENSAFEGCKGITSLSFEDGYSGVPLKIDAIKDRAFYGCTGLSGILTIPSTVTLIGKDAFKGCTSLQGINIIDGNNELNIKQGAFAVTGLSGLLTISKKVSKIGESAFENCTAITALVIQPGEGSLTIGSQAFYGTKISGSLIIPPQVNVIKARAFKDCSALTGLTIESDKSSSPISIGEEAFCRTGISGTLTIPSRVYNVEKSCFENCTSLATLIIESGSSDLVICQRSFYGTGISGKLTIPDRVTDIGESSFRDCNKLTELEIEDYLRQPLKIGKFAFYGTSIANELQIPSRVQIIKESAFQGLSSLTSLVIQSNPILEIGGRAFSGCGIDGSLVLNVKNVKNYAFADCLQLQGPLVIVGGTFGEYVFSGCTKLGTTEHLDKYNIDYSIAVYGGTLGPFDFQGCTNLKGTIFLTSETHIGNDVFNGLKSSGFTLYITSEQNDNIKIDDRAFYESSLRGPLTIPKSVTHVGKDAFSLCSINGELTLEGTGFGRRAFANSTFRGYLTINIDESDGKDSGFDYTTFINCNGFTNLALQKISEIPERLFYKMSFFGGALNIPEQVTSIGKYAFAGCGFTSVTFDPDANDDISIGEGAFSQLTQLTGAIELPTSSVSTYSDPEGDDGTGKKIDPYTFYQCSELRSFIIPNDITAIGNYAFCGCRNLEMTLDFSKITSIGVSAFQDCVSLRGPLEIPTKVKYIMENAFAGCTGLSDSLTIRVSNSQTYIGPHAFAGCKGFKKGTLFIYIEENDEKRRYDGKDYYYVPDYFLRIGHEAFDDCKFSDIYYNGRYEPDCDYDIGIKHTKGIHTSSNYIDKSFCSYPLHKDKLSGGAIAGITIAVIVVVAAIVVLIVFFIIRNKRNKDKSEAEVEMNADP